MINCTCVWLGTDALLWALGVKPPAEVLSRALGELTLTARIQLYALGRLHRLQVVFGFFFSSDAISMLNKNTIACT